jgi:hypothetical protein
MLFCFIFASHPKIVWSSNANNFFQEDVKKLSKKFVEENFCFLSFFCKHTKNLAKKFACQKNGTKTLKGAKNGEKFALSIKKC